MIPEVNLRSWDDWCTPPSDHTLGIDWYMLTSNDPAGHTLMVHQPSLNLLLLCEFGMMP
jgi:hypothetical protein